MIDIIAVVLELLILRDGIAKEGLAVSRNSWAHRQPLTPYFVVFGVRLVGQDRTGADKTHVAF